MANVYCYKVRVGVVLIRDGKILLVRQNNRPFWVFPGGTLEPEEGLMDCAVREMKEEVNLDVSIRKVLYLADFLQPPATGSTDSSPRHAIDVFMLADYEAGTPIMEVTENINEMGFFTLEEFREMAVEPRVAAERLFRDWPRQFLDANGLYLGTYGVLPSKK
jgi:ADP-ribose pyrophosphatase YjhB (NUDIX family)